MIYLTMNEDDILEDEGLENEDMILSVVPDPSFIDRFNYGV